MTTSTLTAPATPAQVYTINKALDQRVLTPEQRKFTEAALAEGLDKSRASKAITWLFTLPFKAVAAPSTPAPQPTLPFPPKGRYAAEVDGVTKHYYVTLSKKTGNYSVSRVGGHFVGVIFKDGGAYAKDIKDKDWMLAIATDPQSAAILYGKTTGTCSICGKELRDKKSVEAGIGPVCIKGTLWDFS